MAQLCVQGVKPLKAAPVPPALFPKIGPHARRGAFGIPCLFLPNFGTTAVVLQKNSWGNCKQMTLKHDVHMC